MSKFIISGFSDEIDPSIDVQFETIKSLGINHFEVRGVNGKNISELSDAEVDELVAKMKYYGTAVSSVGSPIGKISICDPFDSHFALFKRVVDIAKRLGTKYIRIFSFYIPNTAKYEDCRGEALERLSAMKEYAVKSGVILLHENEKGIYGDNAPRCLEIAKQLCGDNFSLVFDPANFVQCGVDTKEAFGLLKNYVSYVHIKDAAKDGTVVPAGQGIGNVEYILKQLKYGGYNGFLSLEPHLGSFGGFAKLENGDNKFAEESDAGKFETAYNALKNILERI